MYRDAKKNEEEVVAPTDGIGIWEIKKNKEHAAKGYPKKLEAMNSFAVASQVSLRVSKYIKKEPGLEMEGLQIRRQKLKIFNQCGASPEFILDFLENEQKIDE